MFPEQLAVDETWALDRRNTAGRWRVAADEFCFANLNAAKVC